MAQGSTEKNCPHEKWDKHAASGKYHMPPWLSTIFSCGETT